jgi:hypothetical protein
MKKITEEQAEDIKSMGGWMSSICSAFHRAIYTIINNYKHISPSFIEHIGDIKIKNKLWSISLKFTKKENI